MTEKSKIQLPFNKAAANIMLAAAAVWVLGNAGKAFGFHVYEMFGPAEQFMRFYATSFLGAYAFTGAAHETVYSRALKLKNAFGRAAQKYSTEAALLVTALLLIGFEAIQSRMPNRSFDWGDIAAYGGALMFYYGVTKTIGKPRPKLEP